MKTGIVKWFDPLKGHGYITPDSNEKDVFVHISAVENAQISYFDSGVKVKYNLERNEDGEISAIDLKII